MKDIIFNDSLGDIAIGLYDIPYSPKATVLYLNMIKCNAVIFGGAMSGKTNIVKNVLARMNEEQPYVSWENTYVLDFGGNIGEYSKLGRVCACFDNSNEENIKRLFQMIEQKLAENIRILNGENYIDYQKRNPDAPLPHITLVIENVTAFLAEERYSTYHDKLTRLVRDGVSKGVSVLLTATDLTGKLNRMMVYFGRKYALEMQKDKYLEIFGTKVDEPMKIPGRGVTVVDSLPCEFQAFLPFASSSELAELIGRTNGSGVEKLNAFPPELTSDNLTDFCPETKLLPSEVLVGLDYYRHSPVALDFDEVRNIAIYGKKQFGKTNLLRLIMRGIKERYPNAEYVFYDDPREQLKEFYDAVSGKARYVTQFKDFNAVVREFETGIRDMDSDPVFFIIQDKKLYNHKRQNREGFTIDGFYLTNAMMQAEERNYYFIMADVPKITDKFTYDEFNMLINTAFLLDSIGDFLAEKGSSSVFNCMDPQEMKREYARCDVGDGYYYDVSREELKKIKIIKAQ